MRRVRLDPARRPGRRQAIDRRWPWVTAGGCKHSWFVGPFVAGVRREADSCPVGLAGGHLDDHEQAGLVNQPELEHLQLDQPSLRMVDPDRRGLEVTDRVVRPPLPELRAGPGQGRYQLGKPGVVGMPADGDAELAEYGACSWLPSGHAGAVFCVGEHHPDHVAPASGQRARIVPDLGVGLVPHQVVEVAFVDRGRARRQRVSKRLQPRYRAGTMPQEPRCGSDAPWSVTIFSETAGWPPNSWWTSFTPTH